MENQVQDQIKALKEQKILALETCTNICSVALWDGEQLYSQRIETDRSHSKKILPMCEAVLKSSNLKMSDLNAIACPRGPGSFTGLRIGVGVAKGLAFGQSLPIYSVSSLMALAYQAIQNSTTERVVALLDARMGELYAAEYENCDGFPKLIGEERLTNIRNLTVDKQVFAGTGAHEYSESLEQQFQKNKSASLSPILFPIADDVIALVQHGFAAKHSASNFAPVYLRDKVTY